MNIKYKIFPDLKNTKWKKGYNKLAHIEIDNNDNNKYKFINIRDYDYKIDKLSYYDEIYNKQELDSIILHSIPF